MSADTEMVMGWFNNPRTRSKMPISPIPTSIAAQRELLEHNGGADYVLFVVEHPKLGPIGLAGLHQIDSFQRRARTITVIGEDAALGKGNGTASRELVLAFGFRELNLQKIVGGALACNFPAVGLLQRQGALLEGFRQREFFRDNSWHDFVEFSRFNEMDPTPREALVTAGSVICRCKQGS